MSVRSSLFLAFFVAAALGLGYVAYLERHAGRDRPPADEAALNDTADSPAQEQSAAAGAAPQASGSAERRMDDFGSGPDGSVVTVPLRERYRQAFAGVGAGSGGGASADGRTSDRPSASAEAEEAVVVDLGIALNSEPSGGEQEEGKDQATKTYRVVERSPGPMDDEGAWDPSAPAVVPSFDIVRVDPLGNTVLAGRAAPFAEVEVKAGEETIDKVTASAQGEWVSTPTDPLGSGDQELSLTASSEDSASIISREVVVVSIPKSGNRNTAASEAVAVLLDREKGGTGRILQAPGQLQGEGQLALKLVDYDEDGAIRLSGAAPPGASVRIYIDNQPTAIVIGDDRGAWIATLDQDLPGGDYTLRLDQLDRAGKAVARLETPLTRVTKPPVEGASKVDYVVVQPGNSLWRIARRLSGEGFNYVYLYEANQAQIRDPDVIYPGQVFEVPAGAGDAAG